MMACLLHLQVLARASTSAMVHQASQGSLISPLGGGAALSPLGALSPMGLAALLGGVPTPRDMSGGGMLGHQQVRVHASSESCARSMHMDCDVKNDPQLSVYAPS